MRQIVLIWLGFNPPPLPSPPPPSLVAPCELEDNLHVICIFWLQPRFFFFFFFLIDPPLALCWFETDSCFLRGDLHTSSASFAYGSLDGFAPDWPIFNFDLIFYYLNLLFDYWFFFAISNLKPFVFRWLWLRWLAAWRRWVSAGHLHTKEGGWAVDSARFSQIYPSFLLCLKPNWRLVVENGAPICIRFAYHSHRLLGLNYAFHQLHLWYLDCLIHLRDER